MTRAWVRLAIAALAVGLTSCGGGGGGGDAGGGTTATGLVPTPPAVGATLHGDASTLRPFRSGARWEYRGATTAHTGATPTTYLTATTQSGVTATGATETTTNSGNNGSDMQTLSLSGGVIGIPQQVDFAGKGALQTINFIELRSPVRQDDQYTILDRRYADTAIDADADGKADALDVAIYARVAGAETVTLPNLPALSAVRVDTVVLSRVTLSSTGERSPVAQGAIRTWYAAGIGIVRQNTTVPTDAGDDVATTDEKIVSWDGVTTGLGALASVDAVVPATNPVFPGAALPGGVSELFAFAMGDHALVFTDAPGLAGGTLASTVDLRGHVLGSTLLAGLSMHSSGRIAAHADGVVYLDSLSSGAVRDYSLTRIDAQGQLVGAVRGVTLGLGGAHTSSYVGDITAAADGNTLWLLWSRPYYDPGIGPPGTELVLRAFSLDGVPLEPERVVDPAHGGGNLQMAASGGQVLMTWTRLAGEHEVMFGSASIGTAATVRTLVSGLPSSNAFVTPLRLGAQGALLWSAVLGTGAPLESASGVLLDASLAPLRAGATLLDEQVPGVFPFDSSMPGAAALGSRIVVTSSGSATLWPGDTISQAVTQVGWLDVGNAALATTPVSTVRVASIAAKRQAVFPDRVIAFGGSGGLTTTVVWLNKGGAP
jgi:hypothetical protein